LTQVSFTAANDSWRQRPTDRPNDRPTDRTTDRPNDRPTDTHNQNQRSVQIQGLWHVMPCRLINIHRYFDRSWCHRNVGTYSKIIDRT